jgi:DNA repair protein RecN (Recombination protein N)
MRPLAVLRELSVQNLALIEDLQVELDAGFCAWTGETGAGKSLLLTALALVLGGKASGDLVRTGKTEARASAVFEIRNQALRSQLETILGITLDEGEMIVTRRVSALGRSSAHVNGTPATIATLQRLGEQMVDIHSQHEGQALLDPDRQRDLLDAYGAIDEPLTAYRRAWVAHDGLKKQRQALLDSTQARQRERALLEFERDELEAADPRTGEYDALLRESRLLASAEALRTAAIEGYKQLYEADHSVQGVLRRVARSLEPLADSAPELRGAAATLNRLADETREVAYSLRGMGRGWEDNPDRLEEIETRLSLYRRLAARFRCTADGLVERKTEIQTRLSSIDHDESELEQFDARLAAGFETLKSNAAALSGARRKAARDFGREIQARLGPLGLDKASLTVEVETLDLGDDPTAPPPPISGADSIEMFFHANPGEAPRPLRKIASGGELSRVTLAAKTVLACTDRVATLVLDEIDAGVGGRLGAALGKTLSELSRHHQVVCVTHLPQVACYARRHWAIRKRTERGRTTTTITPLAETERIGELAAMMRGESAAEGTRREALAMLDEARRQTRIPTHATTNGPVASNVRQKHR